VFYFTNFLLSFYFPPKKQNHRNPRKSVPRKYIENWIFVVHGLGFSEYFDATPGSSFRKKDIFSQPSCDDQSISRIKALSVA
jgi:hypothetical protein